jgi:hypothetical protein
MMQLMMMSLLRNRAVAGMHCRGSLDVLATLTTQRTRSEGWHLQLKVGILQRPVNMLL